MKKSTTPHLRKKRIRYNHELLTKFCNNNNIELLKSYKDERITKETRICGKCISPNCSKEFNKKFGRLHQTNGYCKSCTYRLRSEKSKETYMKRYGVENPSQSEEVKEKRKATCMKNHGVEYSLQSKKIREKGKVTSMKKYGVEHPSQSEEAKEKRKTTCMKIYGVENPLQSKKIREKSKVTCMKNHGVEHPSQSEEVKEKKKATCMKNHGVEHPMQSKEIREKSKVTCMKNHGVENPSQSEEVKEKKKATCMKNHGVKHPMQNENIAEKSLTNAFKSKEYTYPSGKIIKIQGYENFAINDLLYKNKISENEIVVGCKNVPICWYEDNKNKKRRHYVDIFIPSQKLCIEVKSTWTLTKGVKKDYIYIKQQALKDNGYKCEIWVYNKKGELVNRII